jgi:hypothetical protein
MRIEPRIKKHEYNSQRCPDALPKTSSTLGPPNVANGIIKTVDTLCAEQAAVPYADKFLGDDVCRGGHAAGLTGRW